MFIWKYIYNELIKNIELDWNLIINTWLENIWIIRING